MKILCAAKNNDVCMRALFEVDVLKVNKQYEKKIKSVIPRGGVF